MANALVPTRGDDMMFLPVMDMDVAIARRNHVVEFVKKIMVEGTDFGKIPGAGDKPTLLKPGAEKLSTFFGLTPVFISVAVVEDWTGDEHKGEPFFYYRYKCELHRNGNLIASSEGSCNTWESKYRYRKSERVCPNCGQAAIIKGKAEYGGGWVCFNKKGGCGSKFPAGDTSIEGQEVGRVMNPDVADQVNTVQKMAQKRALIAATLLAVNASEFFTQDIEDMVIDAEWTVASEPTAAQQTKPVQTQQKAATQPRTHNAAVDGDAIFSREGQGKTNPPLQQETTEDAPTQHEIAIISQWQGPQDAQNWAMMMGACENEHHAKQGWINAVKECRGYSEKNKQQVFLAYLRHQHEKLGTEVTVAA